MFHSITQPSKTMYYNVRGFHAKARFTQKFIPVIRTASSSGRPIVFLCIGSDRATGDALGPLTGQSLHNHIHKKRAYQRSLHIFGTLEKPVHAINLSDTVLSIYQTLSDPFLIAIDASLGTKEHIGYVTLGPGSLYPGIGVNKQLPSVGDAHITGIVNTCQHTDRNRILQTTHLSTVVELSNFISDGILEALQAVKLPPHETIAAKNVYPIT